MYEQLKEKLLTSAPLNRNYLCGPEVLSYQIITISVVQRFCLIKSSLSQRSNGFVVSNRPYLTGPDVLSY